MILLIVWGFMLLPVMGYAGDSYKDGNLVVDSEALYPQTDEGLTCGKSGNEFSDGFFTQLTINGNTISGVSQVSSPMSDEGTYVRIVGDDDVKLYDNGNIVITGDMDADSYIMENDAQLDNASDDTVTLTENGDVLSIAFTGDDVTLDTSDGGIRVLLSDVTDGTFDVYCNNVTTDGIVFSQGSNQSTITATGTGNDLYLAAVGGDINCADENILTTGTLGAGAATFTSIAGVDTITGSTNSDVISLATDDELTFTSNDTATVLCVQGFEANSATLRIEADEGDNPNDIYNLTVDDTNNNLIIYNDTTSLLVIGKTGNLDMTGGTTITMKSDEVISAAVDDTIQISSNDSSVILEVYSPNTSSGTASLILSSDASTDAGDRWEMMADGSENLVFNNDTATADTFVAKLTVAGADGDITTTGDIEIVDDMDLILGSSSDVKIQWDDGVDDQLLIAVTGQTCTADTDPIIQFLVDSATATGSSVDSDQDVFGISKGTQASNTAIWNVDEDGDTYQLGEAAITGDLTVSGGDFTMTSGTTSKPAITFSNTYDGTTGVVTVYNSQDDASAADSDDGDDIATFNFTAYDDGTPTTCTYASLLVDITDSAVGAEDGSVAWTVVSGGSDVEYLALDGVAGIEFNSGTADVDFTIDGNTTASYFVIDATVESTTLTSAITLMPTLHLENTVNDTTGPSLILENDRSAEGDGDDLGTIVFRGSDDGDATFDAVTILAEAADVTAATEAGKLTIDVEIADTATEMLVLRGDAGAVSTGHFEINGDTADVDTHIDSNDQADMFLLDATTNDLTLTRNLAAGASTDGPILVVTNTSATGDVGVASFLNAADASSTAPSVLIQSSAAGVVNSSLFVNHDGTAGATTQAAVVIDSQDVNTAALYVMSPATAAGTTSQIDDYAVAIVSEGVGGGLSVYRNVTTTTEALLNIREVHADSTAPVVNINTAADATADDSVVTIQASAATLDTTLLDVINAGVGRSIFVDQNITTGTTLVPAMEIDSQATNGAALIIRAPTTLTGTDGDFDDFVMAISAEGVGGALHLHRNVDNPTGPLLKITEDNVMTTSSIPLVDVESAADASASTAVMLLATTNAANDQPVLQITQAGVVETNFKWLADFGTISIFMSDGTAAESNLTGVQGDICFNGSTTAGGMAFCDANGTNWTDM